MSANRIYLVCNHCPQPENALLIAERPEGNATFEPPLRFTHATTWFEKHARCGSPDDFRLALQRPANWDVSPPAQDTVAGGVRMALATGAVNGSSNGSGE